MQEDQVSEHNVLKVLEPVIRVQLREAGRDHKGRLISKDRQSRALTIHGFDFETVLLSVERTLQELLKKRQ